MADQTTPPSSPSPEPPAAATPPRRRRKWLRRLILGAGIVIVLLLVLVLLLPTLLSTGAGTSLVVGQVNSRIPGKVKIDGLSLSWFGGQFIKGLVLTDPDGKIVADEPQIDAPDLSLWGLVRGSRKLGTVKIVNREVNFQQFADGSTNLHRALGLSTQPKPKTNEPTQVPADLAVKLGFSDGKISYVAPGIDPVQVTDQALVLDMPDVSHIEARVTAKVAQQTAAGLAGGVLNAQVNLAGLFDRQGVMHLDQMDLDVKATTRGVPVAAVDGIAKQDGKLVALLGSALTADVQAKGKLSNIKAQLATKTEQSQADVAVDVQDRQIVINPSRIHLTIVPQAWTKLTTKPGQPPATQLLKPFDVDVQVQQFSVARKPDGAIDKGTLLAAVGVKVGDIELRPLAGTTQPAAAGATAPVDLGTIALRGTSADLTFDGPKGVAHAVLAATGEQNGRAGKFDLTADVKNVLFKPTKENPDGALDMTQLTAAVNGGIKDFPLAVVDELGGTKDLITQVAGNLLNATIEANLKPTPDGNSASGTFTLVAKAANLDSKIAGSFTQAQAVVDPGSQVNLALAPAAFKALIARYAGTSDATKNLAIGNPTTVHLAINKATFPLKGGLAGAVAQAKVGLDPVTVSGLPSGVPALALADTGVDVAFDGPGKTAKLGVGLAATPQAAPGAAGPSAAGGPAKINLTADLTNPLDEKGTFNLAGLGGKVTGQIRSLPLTLVDQIGKLNGLATAAVGPALNADLNADLTKPAAGEKLPGANFTLAAKAANLDAQFTGSGSAKLLQLAKGSYAKLTLDPGLFTTLKRLNPALADSLKAQNLENLALAQPAHIDVQLANAALPLEKFDIATVKAGVDATIDQVALTGDPRLQGLTLKNVKLALPETLLGQTLKATLDGDVQYQNQPGTLHADTQLASLFNRPAGTRPGVNTTVHLTNLPLGLVDVFAKQNGLIVALLGQSLTSVDATVANDPKNAKVITFATRVKSDLLEEDISGQLSAEALSLRTDKPSVVDFTLTPAGWDALQAKLNAPAPAPGTPASAGPAATPARGATAAPAPAAGAAALTLQSPAKFHLAIAQLEAGLPAAATTTKPASAALPVDPTRTKFKITLTSDNVVFVRNDNGAKQIITLKNVSLAPSSPDLSQSLTLDMQADVDMSTPTAALTGAAGAPGAPGAVPPATPGAGPAPSAASGAPAAPAARGRLVSKNTITRLFNSQGVLTVDSASIKTDNQVPALPVDVVDALLGQQGKLIMLMGHTANLKLTGDFVMAGDGVANLDLTSENLAAKIPVTLKQGVASISGGTASCKVTHEIAQTYLKRANAMLSDAQSSDKPVMLTINSLTAPTKGFDLAKLQSDLNLELGTLTLHRGTVSGLLVQGLRALGSPIQDRETFPATFTPLKVQIKDGVATSNDLWFSTGDFILGSQMRVHMVQGQEAGTWPTDLLIAIPGDTIQLVPQVTKSISPNSIFEIAASGPLDQVQSKVDMGKLFAGIGKVALESQAGNALGRALPGGIGGIIGQQTAGQALSSLLNSFGSGKTQGWENAQWPNRPKPMARTAAATPGQPNQTNQPQPNQPNQAQPNQPAQPPAPNPVQDMFDLLNKNKKKK